MSLLLQIDQQLKEAMKKKDVERISVLRLLKAAISYASIQKAHKELSDQEVIGVITKEIKKREESIQEYEKAQRLELAEKEKVEIAVLKEFLPQPMTEAEMEELVKKVIEETHAKDKKDLGVVMKTAIARAEGKADGKKLQEIAKKFLS
ncbi:GatB/YqeY domain-containing protein [Methylacidiphilum caldifontis]|uniref:Glutamyl-tRNA amidotransferase n=1 Tax=Methylacidiphilum caldifontis TaxID=2795386 RepID=A0A4Y8PCN2_9BACT|nr:GatB/YqeY domain-containing protein [Methylacidiphilum caldifontis]QSR87856.1 GatB/YqeY domain-containing protein [Methylacidiphilum caldifontis]TFE68955.1 glutamyl-tRNA amidotransferase [Methylacidiphilum caldifontis]